MTVWFCRMLNHYWLMIIIPLTSVVITECVRGILSCLAHFFEATSSYINKHQGCSLVEAYSNQDFSCCSFAIHPIPLKGKSQLYSGTYHSSSYIRFSLTRSESWDLYRSISQPQYFIFKVSWCLELIHRSCFMSNLISANTRLRLGCQSRMQKNSLLTKYTPLSLAWHCLTINLQKARYSDAIALDFV